MESHTEAEAITKWCPMARIGLTNGASVNRHVEENIEHDCKCRASGCMWWTWDLTKPAGVASRPLLTQQQKIDMVRGKGVPDEMKPETGYCGAAR